MLNSYANLSLWLLNIQCSMTIVMQGGGAVGWVGMCNFVFQTFEILLPPIILVMERP